ncbi:hypothetical protein BGP75_09905 [Motiliproteus sp. MSK22-1]|nr:hypothetical protein BGP75_09905 [Motiliproteus sp. MSK22-1]
MPPLPNSGKAEIQKWISAFSFGKQESLVGLSSLYGREGRKFKSCPRYQIQEKLKFRNGSQLFSFEKQESLVGLSSLYGREDRKFNSCSLYQIQEKLKFRNGVAFLEAGKLIALRQIN